MCKAAGNSKSWTATDAASAACACTRPRNGKWRKRADPDLARGRAGGAAKSTGDLHFPKTRPMRLQRKGAGSSPGAPESIRPSTPSCRQPDAAQRKPTQPYDPSRRSEEPRLGKEGVEKGKY